MLVLCLTELLAKDVLVGPVVGGVWLEDNRSVRGCYALHGFDLI